MSLHDPTRTSTPIPTQRWLGTFGSLRQRGGVTGAAIEVGTVFGLNNLKGSMERTVGVRSPSPCVKLTTPCSRQEWHRNFSVH
jgi:hypothetical protein